jgi:Flp pilus assembly protein TadD
MDLIAGRADGELEGFLHIMRPLLDARVDRRQYEVALRRARDMAHVRPASPAAALCLGVALFRCGNYAEALEPLRASGRVSGTENGVTEAFLAMTHWRLGNPEEARKSLARARAFPSPATALGIDYNMAAILQEAEAMIGPAGQSRVSKR